MHFVIEKASLSEVGLWFKSALKLIGSFPEYVATLHLKTSEIRFFFFSQEQGITLQTFWHILVIIDDH